MSENKTHTHTTEPMTSPERARRLDDRTSLLVSRRTIRPLASSLPSLVDASRDDDDDDDDDDDARVLDPPVCHRRCSRASRRDDENEDDDETSRRRARPGGGANRCR